MKSQVEIKLPGGGTINSVTPSFTCEEFGCKNKIAWGVCWGAGWEAENIYLCQEHLDQGIDLLRGIQRET